MAIVSVVIPCQNYGRFLGEAIDSVLAQSHPEVELIVVDYESTDDTEQIVAGYPQANYLRRSNRTLGVARNDGLAASVGEFMWFLDADDRLLPDAVESSLACLEERPECAFAYGHVKHFDASGPAPYRGGAPPGRLEDADPYAWMLRMNNPLRTTGAILYRRRILDAAGGFATDLALSEDLELNMRLARSHPICCNDRFVLEQRIHGATGSLSRKWRQGLIDSVAVQRRQRAHVDAHPAYADAYRSGMRLARSYWGGHLAKETGAASSPREVALNLWTLARLYPAGVMQAAREAVRHKA